MPLINVIVVVIVVGVLVYLANHYLPIDDDFKRILKGIAIIGVVIWLLYIFLGGFGFLSSVRVGK